MVIVGLVGGMVIFVVVEVIVWRGFDVLIVNVVVVGVVVVIFVIVGMEMVGSSWDRICEWWLSDLKVID